MNSPNLACLNCEDIKFGLLKVAHFFSEKEVHNGKVASPGVGQSHQSQGRRGLHFPVSHSKATLMGGAQQKSHAHSHCPKQDRVRAFLKPHGHHVLSTFLFCFVLSLFDPC